MENVLWGAPMIASELALLGHKVADSTVAKYMVKVRTPDPSQRWGTFIRNHMDVTAACDFFVVPTATFRVLSVFVVLSHARRRILHINVTDHPTAAWTARQILEAFPEELPRLLLHDRDGLGRALDVLVEREKKVAPRERDDVVRAIPPELGCCREPSDARKEDSLAASQTFQGAAGPSAAAGRSNWRPHGTPHRRLAFSSHLRARR